MSAQAGSMRKKAASDDTNDCADAGKSCNDARWTCIEQQNFVVEGRKFLRRRRSRWSPSQQFPGAEQVSAAREQGVRCNCGIEFVARRKMLLHFRHTSHPWL